MRSFVVGVAASIVASAVFYFVLAATEALSFPVRLVAMAAVLALGIAVAWVFSRDIGNPNGAGTAVGDQIDAAGDIAVERVDVESSDGYTRVGTNLKSGGTARVSDVKVVHSKDSE